MKVTLILNLSWSLEPICTTRSNLLSKDTEEEAGMQVRITVMRKYVRTIEVQTVLYLTHTMDLSLVSLATEVSAYEFLVRSFSKNKKLKLREESNV